MIESFSAQLDKIDAYTLAQEITKTSGIYKELKADKDKGPEEIERFKNIEELLSGIKGFVVNQDEDENNSLSEFMLDVALLTDSDQEDEEDKDKITLMTIHSSKGLEFPYVYLVGLEENLFPSQLALKSRTELEEERRLFYVAITRAKTACKLSYASSRFQWGKLTSSEPSRFIDELDPKFIKYNTLQRGRTRSMKSGGSYIKEPQFRGGLNSRPTSGSASGLSSRSLKPVNSISTSSNTLSNVSGDDNFMVGDNVEHNRFGKGKILKLAGQGMDKKAQIYFPKHGAKTVILRFAKLKKIEFE